MHITQLLHRMVQQSADTPLTVYGDRIYTTSRSVDRIARLAGALGALGVQHDDRVAYLGVNSDRCVEYLFGVPWADAVVNLVNTRWSAAEIAYSLRDSSTNVLLVDDAFAATIPDIHEQGCDLNTVIFCGDGPCPEGMLDYEQIISDAEPVQDPRRGGDELYGIFYTGGTTGHPKGVMLSHNNLMSCAMGSLASENFMTDRGRVLHAAPMFHLSGICMWIAGVAAGATQVMVPAFTPIAVAEAISKHRVTNVLLVPTMIQRMVDEPRVREFDLSSLQQIVYGASPISPALVERAVKALPAARFSQGYGMTELGPTVTYLAPGDHTDPVLRRSAGRAMPHAEVRVVDAEDNELPRGQVGEIVVRGDSVMLGYWNRPVETSEALRGGWMHTGDMGRMDERGYLYIIDRIKDMIITGGENVYSAEVENALASHPAVATTAVIGVPSVRWGESVHAVVVLHPEFEGTEALCDELRAHCRAHIAGYKVPRSVDFVDALPLSAAGKILKRELREQYWGSEGNRII